MGKRRYSLLGGRSVLGRGWSILSGRVALLADLSVLGCLDAARVSAGLSCLVSLFTATTGLKLGGIHSGSGRGILLGGGSGRGRGDGQRGTNSHEGEEAEEVLHSGLTNEARLGFFKKIGLSGAEQANDRPNPDQGWDGKLLFVEEPSRPS